MSTISTVDEINQLEACPSYPSVQHLTAELARIDVRIRREVRRWQLAGQDPTDEFRGLYVSDADASMLLERPFATSWGQTVTFPLEEEQTFVRAMVQATAAVEEIVTLAREQDQVLRLCRLAETFELDRFELDALLICLAPALDLRYEKLYGYLQDNVSRTQPSVNLILQLLCEPGIKRFGALSYFTDESPMFRHRLLEWASEANTLLRQTLRVEGTVVAWLLGRYRRAGALRDHIELLHPSATDTDQLLAGDVWSELRTMMAHTPIVAFHGPDRMRQDATARLLAADLDRSLLRINLGAAADDGITPKRAVRRGLRDARLTDAIPYFRGWDVCLADGEPAAVLLDSLCAYPDVVILAARSAWHTGTVDRDRRFVWQAFPVPSYTERQTLWQHFLRPFAANEHDIDGLAGQFALTAGQIRAAVSSARDRAARREESVRTTDLFAAARSHSSLRLGSLARKIDPRFGWEDIVLPEDQVQRLRELVATVRGRPQVLDAWGVGRKLASSSGVTALFAGPPGTGKTMAAEVIASELGLDLYKIDLSSVVSKYIGETEKNLERIFDEAEASNAILFFDEADALFGKRSEVRDSHDRYANIEISYLLQRMESYDGVTILATNLRANLDDAFTRRLQFVVDFPFPEEEDRLRIWRTLFPPDVPRADDLDLDLLARRFKLAGGNIRNVIVSAAYLAANDGGTVTMDHLLHGTRRELQKMGKWVGEEDFTLDHG